MIYLRQTLLFYISITSLAACSPAPQPNSSLDSSKKSIGVHETLDANAAAGTSENKKNQSKSIAQIEREAQLRMNNFKLPEGFEISLWADETQTQNPAFFSFDSSGRMLMVETARFTNGVDDIRGHENKTVEDIYITSNEDRLAMYKKYADERPMSYYTQGDDIIRLLQDSDGDRRADKSNVFSDGYNGILDGIGAGVIERDGKVYYTNIPHLWMLEDTDDDGVANTRVSLQDGFGIRISFYGHDLHGLAWGPDGKLYWSIGDRGFNVTTKEGKHFYGPNLGGVFRSDPDGSNIEYFYTGLRNPQELAFDEYGNLFTADNDGDGGDLERVNYLIEGGDSGWHAGHQSIMSFTDRLKLRSSYYTGDPKIPNAWMTQDQYKPRNNKQPAFMLPAIGQLNGGPSGLVYNPGSSFGPDYEDTFFVIHYMGSPAQSNITTFKVEENGAGFTMIENERFLQGFNAVDLDFGPDGAMYISEYNYGGWQPESQGAVYRLAHPDFGDTDEVKQHELILTSDFSQFDNDELISLIKSEHLRIRQRAQFELAKRNQAAVNIFTNLATSTDENELTRLHGIWGLSQMAYSANDKDALLNTILSLTNDKNPQVRIQAVRALGDHRFIKSADKLVALLTDPHPRVAMYAAIGIGRIGYDKAVPTLIEALAQYEDNDLFLRHSLTMALSGTNKDLWWPFHAHESKHVRMGVLLAARRAKDPAISVFLNDKEQALVDEAITAINDLGILEAQDELAAHLDAYVEHTKLLPSDSEQDSVARWQHHRIINANYAQGTVQDAVRLLQYATLDDLPTRLASEALSAIEAWNDINPIDTTTGLPTTASKSRENIAAAVNQYLPKVLAKVQGQALVQSIRMAENNDIDIPNDVLLAAVNNTENSADVRKQALTYLMSRSLSNMPSVLLKLTSDQNVQVRGDALNKLFEIDRESGLMQAKRFLKSQMVEDRQAAYRVLAKGKSLEIDAIALSGIRQLNETKQTDGATLELLDLVASRVQPEIVAEYEKYRNYIDNADMMTRYASSMYGGSIEKGRNIFAGGGASECMRCHMVNWSGGDVGPDLSDIGNLHDNRYLLESIVDVQASIAPGYGTVVLTLNNGSVISGIYQGETEETIKLEREENLIEEFSRDDIASIQQPVSGMPPMHRFLDDYQIRDLVAYMSSLKLEYEKVEEVH
uniref:PVC-type heme-binding CxxCH protein n=1 Tax=Ningiella ruwaisensis TaxID=2364274 RepID=UPI00109F923C|nr:PVC-type heme-binding CxxCH protein [Ningiella ruwaisensis]